MIIVKSHLDHNRTKDDPKEVEDAEDVEQEFQPAYIR
jgi:hypothetical protein